jgi:alkylation response protein AidB-like acyl-CoA dehydrogenase
MTTRARGGSFLVEEIAPGEVFTPEDFTPEHRLIGETCAQWMDKEVMPRLPLVLALDYDTIRSLMRKAGDLGLLGIEIPAAHGGLGLDKISATIAGEQTSRDASMCTTYMAHTGIGTLPIVYFGTDAQKRKYLPRLASGEWISSYSLSEASSASDALNARTRAVLSPDGQSWILNGEKMWLTNSGFADLYIIFAKVDGKDFSAFIIEKGTPGVTLGPEERKLGIRGSSTRPLILTDAVIPRENLLGEIGKGHKIAFNVLNIGRFKLGAGVTGGAKLIIAEAVEYARNRTAFGRPITDFGLIRHKIGEMSILAYVAESLIYRTVGSIDRHLASLGDGDPVATLKGIEEYDVECSMAKVWCSEVLDYVTDETVQIFGGAGFVEDFPAERYWRDARINRIYEGTNEINRLLVPGRLLRRALKQELPIFERALSLLGELGQAEDRRELAPSPPGFLAAESAMVAGAKKAALLCIGLSAQKFGESLAHEQEILGHFADLAMETYALESAVLRTRKLAEARGPDQVRVQEAAVRCFAQDALDRIDVWARRLLAAVAQGETLRSYLAAVARFTRRETVDTVALRRQVATATVEAGRYPFLF